MKEKQVRSLVREEIKSVLSEDGATKLQTYVRKLKRLQNDIRNDEADRKIRPTELPGSVESRYIEAKGKLNKAIESMEIAYNEMKTVRREKNL